MKKRLNRKGWVLLGSLILIVTVLGAAGLSLGRYYWATAVERSGVVYVPTGASFTQLMDSLRCHEVLRNETAFARMARRHGLDTALKAGRYELKEGMSYVRTVRMLRLGWQVPVRVTFNNIRTPDRLAGILARKLEPDSAAWLAALTSDSLARVYGLTPQTIDPATFRPLRTIEVYTDRNKVMYVNEMEWVRGELWANVYTSDNVIRIDPQSGAVLGVIDLGGLLSPADIDATTDVLNGIAFDPATGRIFVTGKNWNKLFEIEVVKR